MPPGAAKRELRSLVYSAPALEKGLKIIEVLAEAQEPLSTRAIAERLDRSKGEIFRMVFVLVERRYRRTDTEQPAVRVGDADPPLAPTNGGCGSCNGTSERGDGSVFAPGRHQPRRGGRDCDSCGRRRYQLHAAAWISPTRSGRD